MNKTYKQRWREERKKKIPYYKEIMYKYLPPHAKIEFLKKPISTSDNFYNMNGYVYMDKNRQFIIGTPPIKRKGNLLTFLHEVGHITFGHLCQSIAENMERYQMEKEAVQFVKIICEREKIPLSKTEMFYMDQHIKNTKNISSKDSDLLNMQIWKNQNAL